MKMRFILTLSAILIANYAYAGNGVSVSCTTASGHKIDYFVKKGHGMISHDNSEPAEMYTYTKDGFAIIKQIGDAGNMTMALDVSSGRGYVITQFDNGRKSENNVYCTSHSLD